MNVLLLAAALAVRAPPPRCAIADGKKLPVAKPPPKIAKEAHNFFDGASVAVQSGGGGDGHVLKLNDGGPRLARTADGDFELPPGGGSGGSVVLVVDTALCDLLHLHSRKALVAERGTDSPGLRNVRATRKVQREAALAKTEGAAPPLDARELLVPVPPGTFVRTAGGRVLGDLVAPGQRLVVATGGAGGPCVLSGDDTRGAGSGGKLRRPGRKQRGGGEEEVGSLELSDDELHEMTRGAAGERQKLELVLRTVADVGLVGFPNAGKSTLLGALTRASPEIAPFPFTTLMPNLGAVAADPADADADADDADAPPAAAAPIVADLPGLIEGAHAGRGLGRKFLSHLRRVKLVLYVLDTSASAESSVVEQYEALLRELYLYNPQYLERPHLVALNKLDVALAAGGDAAFDAARREHGSAVRASAAAAADQTAPPRAVVPLSGLKGKGIKALRGAINDALAAAEAET